MFVQPVQFRRSLGVLGEDQVKFEGEGEGPLDDLAELGKAMASSNGKGERRSVEFRFGEDLRPGRDRLGRPQIGLRQNRNHGIRGDVGEEGPGREPDLPANLGIRVCRVEEQQDQVRMEDLLERRLKRLRHPERDAIDEADRVGEEDPLARSGEAPRGRRQRREHPVLDQEALVRERIQKGRLAGVRITGEGDQVVAAFLPQRAARLPPAADRLELVADPLDPAFHGLEVRIDPLFAARHEPGSLSDVRLVDPFAEERDLVLQERELDLQLPFAARGALREEFEQDP